MIFHLPIMLTVMPPHVTTFLKNLIPVVTFDFIDKIWKWKKHPNMIAFDYEG